MVRGEEREFDGRIERLIEYTKSIKVSLIYFLQRLETEGMEWPQVLDTFTSICGQFNTLMRFTRDNRLQYIENRVVLPIKLIQERDEKLVEMTEGRVMVVNHEMVPDYLRTKPDPDIEEVDRNLQAAASKISPDNAVKQVNSMGKLIDNILAQLNTHRDRSINEMFKQSQNQTFNPSDTTELLIAINTGRGLSSSIGPHRGMPMDPSMGQKIPVRRQGSQKQNIKAPELKTNIKAGP